MTSQTGQQVIIIHILLNISRSKRNEAMKFVWLIQYSEEIIFFQNHAENELEILVQDLFLFFKKSIKQGKRKWSTP